MDNLHSGSHGFRKILPCTHKERASHSITEETVRSQFRVDPRLIIGLLLVAASIAGVFTVVTAMNTTIKRVVATEAIAVGQPIDTSKLRVIDVNIGDQANQYAASDDISADGQTPIATKPIAPGELIPLSALGDADVSNAAMVIPITGKLPASINTGSTVEIWAAQPGERPGTYAAPAVIVAQAEVIRVVEHDDFVVSDEIELEVLVPDGDISTVLSATAAQARIQVVPKFVPVNDSDTSSERGR